jgi:hypothetical protein
VLLHENPSSSQSNATRHSNNKRSTEQERIPACHCMSLPTASQNTQYYLQAGYGLAWALASAEMALFVGALSLGASSLRFDPFRGVSFAVRSVGGVVFAIRSFPRRVFCGSVCWGHRLCGSILSEACLLRFGPLVRFHSKDEIEHRAVLARSTERTVLMVLK